MDAVREFYKNVLGDFTTVQRLQLLSKWQKHLKLGLAKPFSLRNSQMQIHIFFFNFLQLDYNLLSSGWCTSFRPQLLGALLWFRHLDVHGG